MVQPTTLNASWVYFAIFQFMDLSMSCAASLILQVIQEPKLSITDNASVISAPVDVCKFAPACSKVAAPEPTPADLPAPAPKRKSKRVSWSEDTTVIPASEKCVASEKRVSWSDDVHIIESPVDARPRLSIVTSSSGFFHSLGSPCMFRYPALPSPNGARAPRRGRSHSYPSPSPRTPTLTTPLRASSDATSTPAKLSTHSKHRSLDSALRSAWASVKHTVSTKSNTRSAGKSPSPPPAGDANSLRPKLVYAKLISARDIFATKA